MKDVITIMFCMLSFAITAQAEEKGQHLFILSGQSNMAGLKPEESFIPAVEKAFSGECDCC